MELKKHDLEKEYAESKKALVKIAMITFIFWGIPWLLEKARRKRK